MARESAGTVTRYPTRDLINANPAWVRHDLAVNVGSELLWSVGRHGVQVPVVMQPDGVVIDGARRVVAADIVRLATVPVVVCDTWQKAYEALIANKEFELKFGETNWWTDPEPWTWLEIMDWYNRIVRPLYEPTLRAIRGHNAKKQQKQESRTGPILMTQAGEVLGMSTTAMKRISASFSIMNKFKVDGEIDKYTEAMDTWQRVERASHYPSELLRFMEELRRGGGRLIPMADARESAKQVAALTSGLAVMTTAVKQLKSLGYLNDAMSLADATDLLTQLKKIISDSNAVRRELVRLVEPEREKTS